MNSCINFEGTQKNEKFFVDTGNLPTLESSLECDSNVDSDMSSHSLHYQTGIYKFYNK